MRLRFHQATVLAVQTETPDTYSIVLTPPSPEWLDYQPGQYLTFRVWIEGEELRRAFSLSSAPGVDDFLRVTIKKIPGGKVSNYLHAHLQPGSEVEVMPPVGNFVAIPNPELPRHYILIGAGSGITPLYSILRTQLEREPESKVTLWYGSRDEEHIVFGKELASLGKSYGERLHVHHTLSQPGPSWKGFTGRLNRQVIYQLLSDLFMVDEYRKVYYICGPQGLMDDAEAALDRHAVNPAHVFREYYTAPVPDEIPVDAEPMQGQVSAQPETPVYADVAVEILMDGKSVKVPVKGSTNILQGAIEARLDPPYACRSGICTTCRAMLLCGSVSMDETEGLSRQELEEGYILTCQSHPVSEDVVIEFR